MKIVTAALKFLDIDAYACIIAYAELLRLQGKDAVAFSSATLNESITKTIRSWDVPFFTTYDIKDNDTFIVIDVSEPENIEKRVAFDRVEQIIDHHVGSEEYWRKRIGDSAEFTFIGAAATLIYEKWVQAGLLNKLPVATARLLAAGILDNTLNLASNITTPRDITAYNELLKIADLPGDWPKQYFSECQESIIADLENALVNDTTIMRLNSLGPDNIAFGQLAIWNAEQILNEGKHILQQTMQTMANRWCINLVSISEGKSYFLSSNDAIQHWVGEILDAKTTGSVATADRMWLRKEIFKLDRSYIHTD